MKSKNRSPLSKFLALMLAFVMTATLAPVTASAAGGNESGEDDSGDGVFTNKTVTLEDDGTYTINLEAYATGTVSGGESEPCDIVLVLDQSTSMSNDFGEGSWWNQPSRMDALQEAVTNFVGEIADRAHTDGVDYRVAIVGFASTRQSSGGGWWGPISYSYPNTELLSTSQVVNYEDATATDYANALVSATGTNGQVNSRLTQAIDRLSASGDTYSEYGIDMANQIFANNPVEDSRNRAIVVFTDGYPAPSGTNNFNYGMADRAIANAYTAKTQYGASVYTVGIFDGSNPNADINRNFSYGSTNNTCQETAANRYMHYMSSNYPQAQSLQNGATGANDGYYMSAHDTNSLNDIFQQISDSVSGTTVTLDANSEMRDILNTGFALPEGYDAKTKVTAYTADYLGNGNWDDPVEFTDAHITAADGVITISNFSYKDHYVVEEKTEDKPDLGQRLMVTIKGVIPTDEAVTNAAVNTNAADSGIYADGKSSTPSATFPQPQTILTSKVYVLDYAKKITMDPADWKQSSSTLYGDFAKGNVSSQYGTLSGLDYTPKTTIWDGYDNFYAFGKTSDTGITSVEANGSGNLWSKVSVIPANNVYYEDDFVTNTTSGTVGIVYTGSWEKDGTSANNSETANNAVHGGWEENDTGLSNDTAYSDGSAQKGTTGATATFTFTGTGVDIYSRTDMTTGTVTANLYNGTEAKMSQLEKVLIVDNKSDSGTYYQIPTLSFDGLDYGTYTVKITVTNQAIDRTTYYLDGIRVYNPIQNQEDDATVQEAYGNEINAVFTSAKDLLQSGSVAFIDEDENGNPSAGDYTNDEIGKLAPENEIYLGKDQSITLKVDMNAGNSYYLGLKAPNGTANIEVTNGTSRSSLTIAHSTDLYYVITPTSDGQIVVTNTSDNLLSITKLRTTGTGTSGVSENSLDLTEAVNAVTAFKSAEYVAYESEGVAEDTWTEPEENETEDTEEKVTVDPGDITIDNSDNYDDGENQEPEQTTSQVSSSWIANLFNSIKSLFSRL